MKKKQKELIKEFMSMRTDKHIKKLKKIRKKFKSGVFYSSSDKICYIDKKNKCIRDLNKKIIVKLKCKNSFAYLLVLETYISEYLVCENNPYNKGFDDDDLCFIADKLDGYNGLNLELKQISINTN